MGSFLTTFGSLAQTTQTSIKNGTLSTQPPTSCSPDQLVALINAAGGLARQNRYIVTIPTQALAQSSTEIYQANSAILNDPSEANDWMKSLGIDVNAAGIELQAFCTETQLPGYQFQMDSTRHYGPAFQFPHMPEYSNITMTFLCSEQMLERRFFDAWMYLVMDPITNNFNYMSDYVVNLTISSLRQYNDQNVNYATTLIDAFPISLNSQALGFGLNNSFQTLQVTFTYKFAVPFAGKGSTANLGVQGQQVTFNSTINSPNV